MEVDVKPTNYQFRFIVRHNLAETQFSTYECCFGDVEAYGRAAEMARLFVPATLLRIEVFVEDRCRWVHIHTMAERRS